MVKIMIIFLALLVGIALAFPSGDVYGPPYATVESIGVDGADRQRVAGRGGHHGGGHHGGGYGGHGSHGGYGGGSYGHGGHGGGSHGGYGRGGYGKKG